MTISRSGQLCQHRNKVPHSKLSKKLRSVAILEISGSTETCNKVTTTMRKVMRMSFPSKRHTKKSVNIKLIKVRNSYNQ